MVQSLAIFLIGRALHASRLIAGFRLPISNGANKGVSVLPDWGLQNAGDTELHAQKKLTKSGITRKLYAAVRTRDSEKLYMETFLSLSKDVFSRLARPR